MTTLVIEGDLTQARTIPEGHAMIAKVRRHLVTGGRGMLSGAGGTKRFQVEIELFTVTIYLSPLIARRIYTSGAALTEAEITAGLEQLRESNEDVERRRHTEMVRAIDEGSTYAKDQMLVAVRDADERALHRSWTMARKVIEMRKRLNG